MFTHDIVAALKKAHFSYQIPMVGWWFLMGSVKVSAKDHYQQGCGICGNIRRNDPVCNLISSASKLNMCQVPTSGSRKCRRSGLCVALRISAPRRAKLDGSLQIIFIWKPVCRFAKISTIRITYVLSHETALETPWEHYFSTKNCLYHPKLWTIGFSYQVWKCMKHFRKPYWEH